jgi:hypothetical protein
MNLENRLNKLSEINQVDAPPFLYTKIEQRIINLQEKKINPVFKFAFTGLIAFILITNVLVLNNYYASKKSNNLEVVVQNMQLQNNNTFYNE